MEVGVVDGKDLVHWNWHMGDMVENTISVEVKDTRTLLSGRGDDY